MTRIFPAIALLCGLLVACGGGDSEPETTAGSSRTAIVPATPTSGSTDKPTPAPTPEPGEIAVANEAISVETPDGVVLRGHLYSPSGPKRQALIIVAPVDQSIWAESIEAFTSEGIAVFTFDLRGVGETGGEEEPGALAADARLVARFVMSREFPLVYLFGLGQDAGKATTDTAGGLETLAGLLTYGFRGDGGATNHLPIAPDATWDSENVLKDESVRDMVLTFVLGAN